MHDDPHRPVGCAVHDAPDPSCPDCAANVEPMYMDPEDALRVVVRKRVKEIVRKKPGGGGYVLYSPNRGKKNPPKKIGEFPTREMAKQAELNRYPPKDPKTLEKRRKSLERARKRRATKREGLDDRLRLALREAVEDAMEAEPTGAPEGTDQPVPPAPPPAEGSEYEEIYSKLSKDALNKDKKLRKIGKRIHDRTVSLLEEMVSDLDELLPTKWYARVADSGKDRSGHLYVSFRIKSKEADLGPLFVSAERGRLTLRIPAAVQAQLTSLDEEFVADITEALSTFKTQLESDDRLSELNDDRDEYLRSIEDHVDGILSDLGPVEMSLLKNLLVKKYQGGEGV
jgi:hypothetical protein